MKYLTLLLFCAFFLVSVGCSNPKSQLITEKNKAVFLENIQSANVTNFKEVTVLFLKEMKGVKKLTKEESELLNGYLLRYAVIEKFQSNAEKKVPLVGKTVGELIELQRQWKKEEDVKAAIQKKLANEAKAKEETDLKKLRECLTLALYKKGFSPSDTDNYQYQDYITFGVTYQNNSQKDIRAFRGVLEFQDLFGDTVLRVNLKIMDPIKAGGKANWNGTMNYNQFMENDVRLKGLEFKDIKAVWIPEKIIFSDGATLPE
jgi:hypothetical protein